MLKITLRSIWEHKFRMVSTIVAIVLGVAFMCGTLVLGDTIDRTFDNLFTEVNAGVDAQVQGESQFGGGFGGPEARKLLDETLAQDIAALDGVDSAAAFVQAFGFGANNRLIDRDGELIGGNAGPPTLLQNWIDDPAVNPYRLTEGREPEADDEIALNVAAADEARLDLDETITLATQDGNIDKTLVGIFTFGDQDSAAGAISAVFTLPEVQRIAGFPGQIQTVLISIDPDADEAAVTDAIAAALPADAELISGEAAAQQTADQATQFVDFFSIMLQVFATLALLVGIFIIYNTFSILVAQRTQELALLRTLGASRRQVLSTVMIEAVIVGLIAATIGLFAGIALSAAALAGLAALGVDLPTTGLVIATPTVITAFVIGVAVTFAAAVLPAIRATKVSPLAALRSVAIDRSGASIPRVVGGVVLAVVATFFLAQGWLTDGDSDSIPIVGLGAVLAVVAAIVIGPVLAVPSIKILGAPIRTVAGITGRLATENAARSPKRTSLTASALIIGVALIAFVSVFGASANASITSEVERGFLGEFVVQAEGGGFGPPSGFSTTVIDEVDAVDGVASTSSFGFFQGQLAYPNEKLAVQFITAIDPVTANSVFNFRMDTGVVTDLSDDGIIIDIGIVEANDLSIGDEIITTGPGGAVKTLTLEAIGDDLSLLGFAAVTRDAYRELSPEALDVQIAVATDDGADLGAVESAINEAIADVPAVEVLDRQGFIDSIVGQITVIVNVISVLLALSVLIAMIGIANTLQLSIQERTREIGLLRAVGMERAQVRSAIRWEAVLIALLGSLVGLGLGLVLSRAVVQSLNGFGITTFAVPIASLATLTAIAAVLAVLSSLRPASKAAKLPVLEAISTS